MAWIHPAVVEFYENLTDRNAQIGQAQLAKLGEYHGYCCPSPHHGVTTAHHSIMVSPVACFTKEVNPRLAKCPLVFNGRLANHGLTSLVKEATDHH